MTRIRPATTADELAIRRLLDGAMLECDAVPARIQRGEVLVAEGDGRVRGVIVGEDRGEGTRVVAVAVHHRHRRRGIGSALVGELADRFGSLEARFDASLTPFYRALGFDVEQTGSDRCVGRFRRDPV